MRMKLKNFRPKRVLIFVGLFLLTYQVYSQAGSLDTTFGYNGITIEYNSLKDFTYAMAVQADGKIVLAGSSEHPSLRPIVVARFLGDVPLNLMHETGGNNVMMIYPNPARNEIQFSSLVEIEEIKIYSIDGKKVMQTSNPSSNSISIRHLQCGKYHISFKTSNGIEYAQFVKQ
jgi:hypothetical protein